MEAEVVQILGKLRATVLLSASINNRRKHLDGDQLQLSPFLRQFGETLENLTQTKLMDKLFWKNKDFFSEKQQRSCSDSHLTTHLAFGLKGKQHFQAFCNSKMTKLQLHAFQQLRYSLLTSSIQTSEALMSHIWTESVEFLFLSSHVLWVMVDPGLYKGDAITFGQILLESNFLENLK